MNLRPHKAFSLTELIIVLVIIALLFAAMAPIITKRHIAENGSIENIWNFVSNDTQRDAYFDPGYEGWTSSIYVGMDPIANYNNSGKLVINSNDMTYNEETYPQPQLQFRFSPTNSELSNGIDAGSLGIDGSHNISFGQVHKSIGNDNTVLGFSALETLQSANGFVAVGTGALENVTVAEGVTPYITAVGTNAGYRLNMLADGTGIYIGAGAGSGYAAKNIGIGYHASNGMAATDIDKGNVALGVNAGISGNSSLEYINNVIANSYSSTNAGMRHNTIIGYGSYRGVSAADSASDYLSYMTSIGYNACNSIGNDMGLNTCLGYGSASSESNAPQIVEDDGTNFDEHIFLGGMPIGFNGRGVMEVYTHGGSVTTADNADVVLNSNLVVRGKLYAKSGNDLVKYDNIDTYNSEVSAFHFEPKYYRCSQDDYRSMLLTYNVYVCTDLFSVNASGEGNSLAHPKTINLLYQNGTAPNSIISSDERLKDNITENNAGLAKLLLIEPYNYTFKDDMLAHAQVGVIAQDLQKVFPESVSKDEKGFLKIRWDEMFYAMINSIKELCQKVEQITQRVTNLAKEVTTIKSQQKDIRKKLSSIDERVKRLERK